MIDSAWFKNRNYAFVDILFARIEFLVGENDIKVADVLIEI